jgi:hypothetical protein
MWVLQADDSSDSSPEAAASRFSHFQSDGAGNCRVGLPSKTNGGYRRPSWCRTDRAAEFLICPHGGSATEES